MSKSYGALLIQKHTSLIYMDVRLSAKAKLTILPDIY